MSTRGETGTCLRVLRTLRGWSQRRTAAAAGVPATRLSDYETGKISPTVERLEAIVTALGYTMLSLEIARHLVRTGPRAGGAPRAAARPGSAGRVFDVGGRIEEIQGTGLAVGVFVLPERACGGSASEAGAKAEPR
ncbi:MAG TPA: helix-turn-helix transcriptional regulator [Thermoanaerobaculia bacterium]|nr:helix-turn-helix transcriptional regulator [Thermoanaerobaculia bacterium]